MKSISRLPTLATEHKYSLRTWKSDRTLWQEHKGRKVTYSGPLGGIYEKEIIPDGYYVFASQVAADGRTGVRLDRITVEVDLGTQTLRQRQKKIKRPQRTWEHRIRAYLAYFQPGGLYERLYGSNTGRLLVVTTSERRLLSLQEVTETMGGHERFWFTTLEALTPEAALTAPIYTVAGQRRQRYRFFDDPVRC